MTIESRHTTHLKVFAIYLILLIETHEHVHGSADVNQSSLVRAAVYYGEKRNEQKV